MLIKQVTVIAVAALSVATAFAQDVTTHERASSSISLQALKKTDVSIAFDINAEGRRFKPIWGLDQAWDWDRWIYMGIAHMGRENIGIGRTAFRFTTALKNDSILPDDAVQALRARNRNLDIISPTLPLVLTADQGASEQSSTPTYYVTNRQANNAHWAAMINSHVHWLQANTQHPVIGVSPFNEGDYWTREEGSTATKQWQVARMLKQDYPRFADIAIVGGNTLNNDKAMEWYSGGKQYYEWGNTHQLAGSMDNYIAFYDQLAKDGKTGYNDEMHNVAEAMIGLEHGMTVGIWWGFEGRARGEFCQISRHGTRLAYGEHRPNWTAAAVYRHDDGRVKAFLGSSERQAVTTGYQFVSTTRDVYYDGYGPQREFFMEMPGGTGYQVNTPNAERVIDITWGEDVQQKPITDGQYKLYNLSSSRVLAVSGDNVVVQANSTNATTSRTQQWNIIPVSPRQGCDYSYYDFTLVANPDVRMNLLNFSTASGANIIAYSGNAAKSDMNEQWYIQYAGDGYFYVRNRVSALYLAQSGDNVVQMDMPSTETAQRALKWRILPAETRYMRMTPAAPTDLHAQPQNASVFLTWTASTSSVEGYNVIRATKGQDDWNTIARGLTTTHFTDNTCQPGVTYIYKVKAVDLAWNQSKDSETVEAATTAAKGLVGRWSMEGAVDDETSNMNDARLPGEQTFVDSNTTGSALSLNAATGQYLQLPYAVAASDEITIAIWVNLRTGNAWQRIFDFGNDIDHYMFLTPTNGSVMRFAIKNGGDEQQVDAPRLTTGTWHHVAVTVSNNKTVIYVDGEVVGESNAVSIKPSDIGPVMNYIGRSQFIADPLMSASIDDLRIYNYAITASDVQAIMGGGEATGMCLPTNGTIQEEADATAAYGLDGTRRKTYSKGINIVQGKKLLTK